MAEFPKRYQVRPRDKWDGFSYTVAREGQDFADAEWDVTLRRSPLGPIVIQMTATAEYHTDKITLTSVLTSEETALLELGRTYYGELTIWVAGETESDPPAFGPYTPVTWTLEAVAHPVEGGIDGLTVQLLAGGADGEDGEDGAGFALGQDLYIHPGTGHLYMRIDTLYYRGTPTLVDDVPTIAWDTTGTATPT